ncbi:MAG TPA: 30S ribosomal protein S5 [Candidatus Paceibacterota bacterium]|nr:30S ribosomal protein S5 [Candidatus Paceibacterota bacterium]
MMNQSFNRFRGRRSPREISEFKEKTLEIRRVTRVVAGGKRFSFRASVVLGDMKGRVGLGVAKGLDVASAIGKAKIQAKKSMIKIPLKDDRTLFYDVEAKYGAARVRLKPARPNHGLIAGGAVRPVLELAGVRDVSAKIMGRTTSKISNARAALEALKKMKPREKKQENAVPQS